GMPISPELLKFDVADSERESEKELRVFGDEVIRVVNRIIAAGLEREASDIHVEPDLSGLKVRFRIHGDLFNWNELIPISLAKGVISRFKVLSGLDLTERRRPQDGRIGITLGKREIDLRIATVP